MFLPLVLHICLHFRCYVSGAIHSNSSAIYEMRSPQTSWVVIVQAIQFTMGIQEIISNMLSLLHRTNIQRKFFNLFGENIRTIKYHKQHWEKKNRNSSFQPRISIQYWKTAFYERMLYIIMYTSHIYIDVALSIHTTDATISDSQIEFWKPF